MIDRISAIAGSLAGLFLVLLLLAQFFLVIQRYAFGFSPVWWSELVQYCHGCTFLLAGAWVLQTGKHVRVDIFYSGAKDRMKKNIDAAGGLLLGLPVVLIVLGFSYPYVSQSWSVLEGSPDLGGLPARFLLKSIILLAFALFGLQLVALLLKLSSGRGPATGQAD